jgi:hypothetical protein
METVAEIIVGRHQSLPNEFRAVGERGNRPKVAILGSKAAGLFFRHTRSSVSRLLNTRHDAKVLPASS